MKPSLLKQVQAHSTSDNSAMNLFDGKNKKVYTQPLFIEYRISIELHLTLFLPAKGGISPYKSVT